MTKEEELKEAKERIISEFTEAMESDSPFILITENEGSHVFSMGGNPVEITRMFVKSMERSPEFNAVVNVATKVQKTADRIIDPQSKDFNIQDLKDDLDCEDCEQKDNCEILRQIDDIQKSDTPMKASIDALAHLLKTHPHIKPKAQA